MKIDITKREVAVCIGVVLLVSVATYLLTPLAIVNGCLGICDTGGQVGNCFCIKYLSEAFTGQTYIYLVIPTIAGVLHYAYRNRGRGRSWVDFIIILATGTITAYLSIVAYFLILLKFVI